MPLNEFAPYLKINGCFLVKNISSPPKTLFIFNYPIPSNMSRDLLAIKGISESDIRSSLLKGELNHKIRSGDITVECSDIDLLQFNQAHKEFLQSAGIVDGLEVTAEMVDGPHKTLRQLIHLADGVGGPMEGFLSNAYRETLPQDSPFPTSIIWYTSSAKLIKIIEKFLSYDVNKRITIISWAVYDSDGVLLATVTDTFNYNGNSPFESSRTRTINEL